MVSGNPSLDFFEQNPELQYITEFAELKKSSKNYSKILWSIYLLEDPRSKFFRMTFEERLEEIRANYFKLDIEKHSSVINSYKRLVLTREQQLYKIYQKKMEDLTESVEKMSLKEDKSLNNIIKIFEKLPKMWEGLEVIKKKMLDKENNTDMKGSGRKSARENRSKR